MTAFIYHQDYLKHKTGFMHPEHEGRLIAIIDHLKRSELWNELLHLTPVAVDLSWILAVHTREQVEFVKERCQRGVGVLDQGDTQVCRDSYEVALLAAGGLIGAVDTVITGKAESAFCAVRPPGHHAESSRSMGFCLFNNVAIGVRYVQRKYGLKRVAVVDWDVHHGNGTQEIFYDDPSALYISTHQYPFYPGTGRASERGQGRGKGFTLNLPLRAGTSGEEYVRLFTEKVVPALENFRPEIIFVSAGFDAHRDDPLAGIHLTEETYSEITRLLKSVAKGHCGGKIISVLEGGYNLKALPLCVEAHLRVLVYE